MIPSWGPLITTTIRMMPHPPTHRSPLTTIIIIITTAPTVPLTIPTSFQYPVQWVVPQMWWEAAVRAATTIPPSLPTTTAATTWRCRVDRCLPPVPSFPGRPIEAADRMSIPATAKVMKVRAGVGRGAMHRVRIERPRPIGMMKSQTCRTVEN